MQAFKGKMHLKHFELLPILLLFPKCRSSVIYGMTHLCLFSATLSSSQTSLEWSERTSFTPHSSSTARARSGPAVRASLSVTLSGLILPSHSVEPLDQLLPLTSGACCESAILLYCWDSWIKSFHSSKVRGSTPAKHNRESAGARWSSYQWSHFKGWRFFFPPVNPTFKVK